MRAMALRLRDFTRAAEVSWPRTALLACLWALALASIVEGFVNAVRVSTDFQWSPTLLLSEGANPYQVALSGNPEGRILLSQYPPYLHWLYIVMLPLALLPYSAAKFTWALLNLAFAGASLVMLARLFRLSAFQGALLAALFFVSTPYRNAVGNGQTSLLCLFALLIAWAWQGRREIGAGVALSLLLAKYSFAPPIGLWFLLRGRFVMLLASVVLLVFGWLAFSWICHEDVMTTVTEPVKVANLYSESEGGGDIMTLVQSFGWDRPVLGAIRLSALIGLATCCVWIAAVRVSATRLSVNECLAALCLISLLSIRHLAYDFVFLAPVAALAFSFGRSPQTLVVSALAYFAFGLKVLTHFEIAGRWVEFTSFLALNLMLLVVLTARGPRWRA